MIGPIYFVIYFLVFYGLIRAFNLQTPGREDVQAEGTSGVDAAETRLRVVVKHRDRVTEAKLAAAGVPGHVWVGDDTVHLIVGLNADQYATEMRAQMAGALVPA